MIEMAKKFYDEVRGQLKSRGSHSMPEFDDLPRFEQEAWAEAERNRMEWSD